MKGRFKGPYEGLFRAHPTTQVSPKKPLGAPGPGLSNAYLPPSSVPALRPREGDGSHLRDQHSERGALAPSQAREPRRSRAPSFLPARACRRHEKGGSWSMVDPCGDCIALAFGQELPDVFRILTEAPTPWSVMALEAPTPWSVMALDAPTPWSVMALDYKPACTSHALDSGGNVDQDAGGVPRDPLESLGTPGPSGLSSPLLTYPRHRRRGGWTVLDPCQDCLSLATQAGL